MAYSGWYLPEDEQARLLALFPPAYPDVVAHHITLTTGKYRDLVIPPEVLCEVVGIADDKNGVQALVVRLNGTTVRPDGGWYHITWSIDREAGRKPFDSNEVIGAHSWWNVSTTPITVVPKIF